MTKIADTDVDPVNDSGTGRDGTRVDETWYDAFVAVIDALIHSVTNTTVTPADIIDEVVEARGSQASLDDRWDEEHNEDGTHDISAGALSTFVTQTDLMGGLGGINLLRNDDFLCWPDGDAAAPLYWPLTGAAAVAGRTGTGLGDTTRKVNDYACKVSRFGTDCFIENSLLSGTAFTRADFLKGKYIAFGMWAKCSTPNIARVQVYDGIAFGSSSYHTGGGTWEWLSVVRQIDSSATEVSVRGVVVNSNGNAVFDGACALLLDSAFELGQYQPGLANYGMFHFGLGGNLSVGTNLERSIYSRGAVVKDVQCLLKTAPTGAAAIFDINTLDSGPYTSMFAAGVTVAAGATRGGGQPDGATYARRCLRGGFGTAALDSSEVTLDVDQVGSGVTGADAVIEVRLLQYSTPLERFMNYND
jgi:hypothetical protein